MKKHEPDLFARVRWVVLPHDYVTLCLCTGLGYDMNVEIMEETKDGTGTGTGTGTGIEKSFECSHYIPSVAHLDTSSVIPTTDLGDASGTGFLHPEKAEYVPELAKLIHDDFESCLPRILAPNDISGYLSKQWRDILFTPVKATGAATATAKATATATATANDSYYGYSSSNHKNDRIPVSVGTGDNMASALGCKCIKTGNVVLSLGTSGTIFGVSDESLQFPPKHQDNALLSPMSSSVAPFRDATGRYLPLVCVMSCTGVLNSVLKNWCFPSRAMEEMDHEEAIALAKNVPVGCHGLTFLPYLGGERTPDWPHATGALLGLTPQNMSYMGGNTVKMAGIMYRCAMEGITFLLADALEEMLLCCRQRQDDDDDSITTPSIMVVGGGSKNPLWRQMLADVLGANLLFPTEPESAALGAAFQVGAVATGVNVIQFIDRQPVPMEDVIVTPTMDPTTIEMYRHARQRFQEYSTKLFSTTRT
jgi:sugar (pentulose or hexulose) kinase